MQFMLLFSRQGKLRLQKWYVPLSDKEKKKITRELVQTILARKPKMCSFLEWRDLKIVYKRWARLGRRIRVIGATLASWLLEQPSILLHYALLLRQQKDWQNAVNPGDLREANTRAPFKQYASLYFCCAVEDQDNELITLEIIHRYVELLDKYFGSVCFCLSCCHFLSPVKHLQFVQDSSSDSKVVFFSGVCVGFFFLSFFFEQQVCELDIIFNFEKAYFILDEFLLGGEAQETSKKNVLKAIEQADLLQEDAETPRSVLEEIGLT
ncbi:unnamed protein product [Tetraodon nigroviridis]|uniref:(spotted green pufferfish) hypothetical protein n=1 Tax=Tetraodon nigroviridis TaxID=99883 RepID=Q4SV83_TETNG|nr:unnamed protein product [Tetraodon nigroviridis]